MSEPQDAGKYQVSNDGTIQGQVIGDHTTVHQHFYGTQEKATPPTKLQRVWNIPYLRNDYFTGREEILQQLHTRFKAGNATALSQRHAMSGLGGIGKTQTAVEYAYRYHEGYQAVLWARAESHEMLTSSFVEIASARYLNLPQKDEQDQTLIVDAVKHWLQDNKGWLLILDNADEPAIVREFLPTKCDGHILLTTRAQALGGLAQRIEVDTFTPELGALFLLRRATLIAANGALDQAIQSDREVAVQISKELGGLPLALDQAGAYLEETGTDLASYWQIYQQYRVDLLRERRGLVADYPDPVVTTWSFSFQKVEEKNPAAAELLHLCAYLAPDAIPEETLTASASLLGLLLAPVAADSLRLNQAIEVLRAYSLVRRDPKGKILSIHRLVQIVLQDTLEEEERRIWVERAILVVNAVFPHTKYSTWSQCERVLPQAVRATQLIELYHIVSEEAGHLLYKTASYLKSRARYKEAEPLYQRALHIWEQQVGSEHPDMTSSLTSLATLYYEQGKYGEAEPLYQRALRIWEQQAGSEHPTMVYPLNNLANFYREQGKYAEAEPLSQRALHIWEHRSGPDHPQIAYPFTSLAILYYEQRKYEEAEPLYQRALHIWEQQLGPEHPTVAYPLKNLATLYREQSKYAEAEPLYRRALHIRKQALGPQHPKTTETRRHFIALLRAMGRDEEAKQLEEGNES